MSEAYYSFRNSTSEASEASILAVMNEITGTFADITSDVDALKPHWIADEADAYCEGAKKLAENGKQIGEILQSVKEALMGARDGTDEFREAIGQALDNSH